MTARSYFRGHKVIWNGKQWLYEDNNKPKPTFHYGGKIRPCVKCGKVFPLDEADSCLGILPGVDDACCGHGISSESYIKFKNGTIIRGFEKIEQQTKIK